jgi:hypothetical protein
MSKNDKAPDSVTHSTEFVIGHQPFLDKTVIHKDDDTYTGYGWDRDEADRNAGEKYERGKKD